MKIIGHTKIRDQLERLIKNKSFPQTAIFYGLDGIGKRRVALEVAGRLLGGGAVDGNHPDLFMIRPTPATSQLKQRQDQNKTGKIESTWTIKIEQVSDLKGKLIHFPLKGDYQVVLIDHADKMTAMAANSLLKILEEPRPSQIFILITSRLGGILPTLRSRSARFYFPSLGKEEVARIIQSLTEGERAPDPETFDFLFKCFHGSVGHILEALESGINLELLSRFMQKRRHFKSVSRTVGEVVKSGVDLSLLLQCLRVYGLNESESAEPEFFHRIRQAEFRLGRHIQKEFVLENLFL